jgi:hypothetical protein
MQPAICRKSPRSCGRPRCASSRGSPHPDRADSECLRPLPRLVVPAPKRDQSVEHHRVGWQIDDARLRPLPQDALPVHAPPSATAATTCQAEDAQTPDAPCPPVIHHEIFAMRSVPISGLTPAPLSRAHTGTVAADRLAFIPAACVLNRDDRGSHTPVIRAGTVAPIAGKRQASTCRSWSSRRPGSVRSERMTGYVSRLIHQGGRRKHCSGRNRDAPYAAEVEPVIELDRDRQAVGRRNATAHPHPVLPVPIKRR